MRPSLLDWLVIQQALTDASGMAPMPAYPLRWQCVYSMADHHESAFCPQISTISQPGCCIDTDQAFACACRFAELLVDAGGVQQLLHVPRSRHTFAGLSFAFFGLSAIPLAFERVVSRTA